MLIMYVKCLIFKFKVVKKEYARFDTQHHMVDIIYLWYMQFYLAVSG